MKDLDFRGKRVKHDKGGAHHVRSACEAIGQRWAQGISQCERLFSSA